MKNALDKKLLGPLGLLGGVGLLFPAAGPASAETQTFTLTATPTTLTSPGSSSDSDTTTVSFDQFDPSLGSLSEVDISLSSTLAASSTLSASTNEGFSSSHWSGETKLTLPGVSFDATNSFFNDCSFCTNQVMTPSFPISQGWVLTSGLSPYVGLGMVDANLELDVTFTLGGEFLLSGTASGSGTWDPPPPDGLTITYVYEPSGTAPEPGSLALLGAAVAAGAGFIRRRVKDPG